MLILVVIVSFAVFVMALTYVTFRFLVKLQDAYLAADIEAEQAIRKEEEAAPAKLVELEAEWEKIKEEKAALKKVQALERKKQARLKVEAARKARESSSKAGL